MLLVACSDQPDNETAESDPPPSGPAMGALRRGDFVMGTGPRYLEEGPPRRVQVAPFAIDVHHVTNAAFAYFVAAISGVHSAGRK